MYKESTSVSISFRNVFLMHYSFIYVYIYTTEIHVYMYLESFAIFMKNIYICVTFIHKVLILHS